MHPLTIATIQTNIPVSPNDLEAVKKALSTWLKQKGFAQHGYFHNHKNEDDPDFQPNEYPLVQFRCPNGLLLLWGLQQGSKVLQQMMLAEGLRGFRYKGTSCHVIPDQTAIQQYTLGFTEDDELVTYELNYFVAFTAQNFKAWQCISPLNSWTKM